MKTVVTITGIRPDFIRMSEIFRLLDENLELNHILIHTGQHYDDLLSGVFFQELNIRQPDYILNTGKMARNHYEQLSYLAKAIPELFQEHQIKPDLIIFLGDANTCAVSFPLKKEGYKIGHIEAGMRSYDKRMLEEVNRTVCDHCSDLLLVYHEDYKEQLARENVIQNVYVVGNTIKEVCLPFIPSIPKRQDMILLDIHRPENFKYRSRLENILRFAHLCMDRYQLPVKMLKFPGTTRHLQEFGLDTGRIEVIDLMSFKQYLDTIYHCRFLISDSGTAQEEPAMFKTPVLVPRDFTERPQSIRADCSYMLNVNTNETWEEACQWVEAEHRFETDWLGDGQTAERIVKIIQDFLTTP